MTILRRTSRAALRAGGVFTGGLATVFAWDGVFNDSTLIRNIRTVKTTAQIAMDYKLNFKADNTEGIDDLHTRTAMRILHCCQTNGGLYIKFGQQIAQQAAILPPQYNEILKVMYDRAPVVGFDEVRKIFREEFGKEPDEMFKSFEPIAFASASIAQVHRAELFDGTQVAVKVQKPYIRKQLDYDLFVYRMVCLSFEKLFELPIYWSTAYTEKHLREEVDFIKEGHNAEMCNDAITKEPRLASKLYVPKVYWDVSSPRVLTAEWIDGTSLIDHEIVASQGHSLTSVMTTLVDLFSHQIFVTGFLHCDPHPGNILVRKNPLNGESQVVVLDHGLYIRESESFRHQYALFWKSLFMVETDLTKTIAQQWGIKDAELLATATLLRPYSGAPHRSHLVSQKVKDDTRFGSQVALKERAQKFLSDTEALPRELIFVGRNMNIVRANNKLLGSPVNRISRMADWAIIGLAGDWKNHTPSMIFKRVPESRLCTLQFYTRYLQFRLTLLSFDVVFYAHWIYQKITSLFSVTKPKGFEELLDNSMIKQVKDNLGIDLAQAFEG
ncbi:hypothetical protein DSO57_1005959 [Entomophthora muscae]|uniref:Uncharacterized protein n=1 Tax=Entomophthora muscae TaxID=34485 RepID=A0ACC2TV82_9FUNG|nr:hypothetical protein DSO57_1005959 [Entomophthora muscae]